MHPKPEWCFLAVCLLNEGGKYQRVKCFLELWSGEGWRWVVMWKDGLHPWLLVFCICSGYASVKLFLCLCHHHVTVYQFLPYHTPPFPASWWGFMADIPVCVWVCDLLLLISCLFFMMFQLIHHIPCALEWNSTHMNPWRLKKSSQGIFLFLHIYSTTCIQTEPLLS